MKTEQKFIDQFHRDGFCIEIDVIPESTVKALKQELSVAIEQESPLRREGIDDPLQVVCCPYYSNIFLDALEPDIYDRVDMLLGPDSIIYSYNNTSMPPGSGNFSSRVHRDSHSPYEKHLQSIGALVLLDDFSEENGATWYLPKSHTHDEKICEEDFFEKTERLIAPAGSVFFFHPRLLHAGGINRSSRQRDGLAIGFCKPNLKQRLNLPEILGTSTFSMSAQTRKKIGLNSQPPNSILEFYQNQSLWHD